MIPDKNFRMSKQSKVFLASGRHTKGERDQLKRALIQAQLSEESARRSALKNKANKDTD